MQVKYYNILKHIILMNDLHLKPVLQQFGTYRHYCNKLFREKKNDGKVVY